MKVIIAGTRTINDPSILTAAIQASAFTITQVVSGGAHGVDRMGEDWAINKWADEVPGDRQTKLDWLTSRYEERIKVFPADWSKWGLTAGRIRNIQMAEYADALIAIWDGKSRGTWHMINTAQRAGLRVYIYNA